MKWKKNKLWKLQKEGENKFSCHICDKKFTDGPSLKTHIETFHDRKKPKSYESPQNGGVNKFSCHICDMRTLKTHVGTVYEMVKPKSYESFNKGSEN